MTAKLMRRLTSQQQPAAVLAMDRHADVINYPAIAVVVVVVVVVVVAVVVVIIVVVVVVKIVVEI